MRLGLIADVHEAVEPLREALAWFAVENVDEILVLGDICRMHRHLEETVAILREAGVVGVWGNHDFGLCRNTDEAVRKRFSPEVITWMGSLQPTLSRADCLFSHVEPWLDPNDLAQLWYFEGPPDNEEKRSRAFTGPGQRVSFSGHVHRWFLTTPDGIVDWNGAEPIVLAPPTRYLVIVDALCAGSCAIYDTETALLTPHRVTAPLEE